MGSTASKTARRCLKPSRVTATEPIKKNRLPDSHRTKGQNSTSKQISLTICVEIEDAGDPHFLANLSRLGPVRVNHSMETPHPVGYIFLLSQCW
jgi:hypothetical protein